MDQKQASSYLRTRFSPNANRNQVWAYISEFLIGRLDIQADASVLELGAGYGSWIRTISCRARYALDINPGLAQLLESEGVQGVVPYVGSCTRLSQFESNSLDCVLASNLLEHLSVDEIELCMAEVWRVLKPGGRWCLIQPNFRICSANYFDDYTHRTIFTDASLGDWTNARGFETVWSAPRFLPLSMKATRLSRLSFLVPLYLRSPIKPFAGQMALIVSKCRRENVV